MKRIVGHWTGGGPVPSATDLRAYHGLVDQECNRHDGDLAPEANRNISDGIYARHSGGFNTDAVGLSACGMLGAQEGTFDPGLHPIKMDQFNELCRWKAEMCVIYGIEVSRDTVVLHSEVLPRFGRGIYKWDINWLPGMDEPGDPFEMGDRMRDKVQAYLRDAREAPVLSPSRQPTIKSGSTGYVVEIAQRTLEALGYDVGPVDGHFGPLTESAVMQFQVRRDLFVDGVVGPNTWAALL